MSRVCTICTHPQSAQINQAVLAQNGSLRSIAAEFNVTESALRRHRPHIDSVLVQAVAAERASDAHDLLDQLRSGLKTLEALEARLATILTDAWNTGDKKMALAAIREFARMRGEIRASLELLARLQGQLPAAPEINLLLLPQWMTLRGILVDALQPHPEARHAVMRALSGIEAIDITGEAADSSQALPDPTEQQGDEDHDDQPQP